MLVAWRLGTGLPALESPTSEGGILIKLWIPGPPPTYWIEISRGSPKESLFFPFVHVTLRSPDIYNAFLDLFLKSTWKGIVFLSTCISWLRDSDEIQISGEHQGSLFL